nr:DNA helicase [Tanacetum cinerariifolium]
MDYEVAPQSGILLRCCDFGGVRKVHKEKVRRDLKKRLGSGHVHSMSESLEPRRGHSESPRKRDPERKTVFKRLEIGVFHKLEGIWKKLQLGVLGDDNEWEITIQEAYASTTSAELRFLFAHILMHCDDEAPMNDRRCFEALDRSLRDVLIAPCSLFGGKTIVLGGDFRQTLHVRKGASKMEVMAFYISANEHSLINSSASWLLDIDDGKVGQSDEEDPEDTSWIDIPP